jgi:ABC-type glycerol-3-phosphate transport system permease component
MAPRASSVPVAYGGAIREINVWHAWIMPLIVHQPTLKHYVDLLTQTSFLTWTYNTMLVAVVSTAVSLVLGTMMAYPRAGRLLAGVKIG